MQDFKNNNLKNEPINEQANKEAVSINGIQKSQEQKSGIQKANSLGEAYSNEVGKQQEIQVDPFKMQVVESVKVKVNTEMMSNMKSLLETQVAFQANKEDKKLEAKIELMKKRSNLLETANKRDNSTFLDMVKDSQEKNDLQKEILAQELYKSIEKDIEKDTQKELEKVGYLNRGIEFEETHEATMEKYLGNLGYSNISSLALQLRGMLGLFSSKSFKNVLTSLEQYAALTLKKQQSGDESVDNESETKYNELIGNCKSYISSHGNRKTSKGRVRVEKIEEIMETVKSYKAEWKKFSLAQAAERIEKSTKGQFKNEEKMMKDFITEGINEKDRTDTENKVLRVLKDVRLIKKSEPLFLTKTSQRDGSEYQNMKRGLEESCTKVKDKLWELVTEKEIGELVELSKTLKVKAQEIETASMKDKLEYIYQTEKIDKLLALHGEREEIAKLKNFFNEGEHHKHLANIGKEIYFLDSEDIEKKLNKGQSEKVTRKGIEEKSKSGSSDEKSILFLRALIYGEEAMTPYSYQMLSNIWTDIHAWEIGHQFVDNFSEEDIYKLIEIMGEHKTESDRMAIERKNYFLKNMPESIPENERERIAMDMVMQSELGYVTLARLDALSALGGATGMDLLENKFQQHSSNTTKIKTNDTTVSMLKRKTTEQEKINIEKEINDRVKMNSNKEGENIETDVIKNMVIEAMVEGKVIANSKNISKKDLEKIFNYMAKDFVDKKFNTGGNLNFLDKKKMIEKEKRIEDKQKELEEKWNKGIDSTMKDELIEILNQKKVAKINKELEKMSECKMRNPYFIVGGLTDGMDMAMKESLDKNFEYTI